jgi:hypothetical protein
VVTQPWQNREIFIKLFTATEGRDVDNAHGYGYVSVQVRYDPQGKELVHYSWKSAYKGYVDW